MNACVMYFKETCVNKCDEINLIRETENQIVLKKNYAHLLFVFK